MRVREVRECSDMLQLQVVPSTNFFTVLGTVGSVECSSCCTKVEPVIGHLAREKGEPALQPRERKVVPGSAHEPADNAVQPGSRGSL